MPLAPSRPSAKDDKTTANGSARFSFADIRRVLFHEGPPKARTLGELKEGISRYIKEKHARR